MSFVKYYSGIEFEGDPIGFSRRIKVRFNTWVPKGAQAITVKTTLNFEEPFTEIVGGVVRPGVEKVDFVHELTHAFDFRHKRNALECWLAWIKRREELEARAKDNENRFVMGLGLIGIRYIPPDVLLDFR